MKANGEDKYGPATVLMTRAETEEPEPIYPCNIAQLVKDEERGMFDKSWARNGSGDGKEQEDWALPKPVGWCCIRFSGFRLINGFSGPQSRLSVQTRTRSPGLRKHSPQTLFKLGTVLPFSNISHTRTSHKNW